MRESLQHVHMCPYMHALLDESMYAGMQVWVGGKLPLLICGKARRSAPNPELGMRVSADKVRGPPQNRDVISCHLCFQELEAGT